MQTLYSCIYLTDRKLYEDDPVIGPFVKSMLFLINLYHRRTIYSNVLRDEEVQFPPQADHTFNPEKDPMLAGLNVSELLLSL
jgi:hypothetical protein